MTEEKSMRLTQLAKMLGVGTTTVVDFLSGKGFHIENNPNTKLSGDQIALLKREFRDSMQDQEEASEVTIGRVHAKNVVIKSEVAAPEVTAKPVEEVLSVKTQVTTPPQADPVELTSGVKLQGITVVGKIDLSAVGKKKPEPAKKAEEPKPEPKKAEVKAPEPAAPVVVEAPVAVEPVVQEPVVVHETAVEAIEAVTAPEVVEETTEEIVKDELVGGKADTLKGLTVLGKIELPVNKPKKKEDGPSHSSEDAKRKRKRVRIEKVADSTTPKPAENKPYTGGGGDRNKGHHHNKGGNNTPKPAAEKEEISNKEIQDKIRATIAKIGVGKAAQAGGRKYRKEKRAAYNEAREEKMLQDEIDSKVLKVTEFISANDLATLMNVSVMQVISTCMSLGMFVSINQRLDAETITIIADEFGYEVSFTTTEEDTEEETDNEETENLTERAPIVTIMGHVDHGKTSLLDYIRKTKIAAKEAGGITQHIGAYSVQTAEDKPITFLDTPGHEAFTAMRARGAKVTDIVILVVAADDRVMPQTKEAINHAKIAGVPIIIALTKIDKPAANPEKIKEELANENILVEDWGGKYQCQEVSSKSGQGINELLDKVLIEAELLELKANADKKATGTVVEASLDKGRGYLTTVLVQSGTLKIGDIIVVGANHGRVRAMNDHLGTRLKEAGPSMPVQILGLDGAPQAGEKFKIVDAEREAREIATKRAQILREQSVRTKKHLTLDEIGRRLAIGNFKELNIIIKADVDGSMEALTDSLLKLSTNEVQVNVIHKGVGQITESDVLLASASDAIILGFQVRPSAGARKIADQEQIEIRSYSIIYKAIEEMKDALEGLLEPTIEEVIVGNVEVREVFKIPKVGTVAGCYVTDGSIKRNSMIRLIREGIVIFSGNIDALKRFKDDVAEVKHSYECGISLKNFNDIVVGDTIEAYEEREIKRKL